MSHVVRALGVQCPKCKAFPLRSCVGETAFDGVHASRVHLALEGRPPSKFESEDEPDDYKRMRFRR